MCVHFWCVYICDVCTYATCVHMRCVYTCDVCTYAMCVHMRCVYISDMLINHVDPTRWYTCWTPESEISGTANPTWGDIFESSFKAQSSKLERLLPLKGGKRHVRALQQRRWSFELRALKQHLKMWPQVGSAVLVGLNSLEIRSATCTSDMGWLQLVASIKLQVSFAEYSLFYGALLQTRPTICRSY